MQTSSPPPVPTLRVVDPRHLLRQRMLLALCWLLSVVAAFFAGRHLLVPDAEGLRAQLLAAQQRDIVVQQQLQEREQRITNLERGEQIARLANENVQTALAEKDSTISRLRRELALFERLIGPNAQAQGLTVHELALVPAGNGVVTFDAVLTQTRNVRDGSTGRMTLSVEGQRSDQMETLAWSSLVPPEREEGIRFDFRYFQRLQGSFVLPPDFRPLAVEVRLQGRSIDTVKRRLSWADAVKPGGT